MPPGSDNPDINVYALINTTSDTWVQEYEEKLALVLGSWDMDEYLQN